MFYQCHKHSPPKSWFPDQEFDFVPHSLGICNLNNPHAVQLRQIFLKVLPYLKLNALRLRMRHKAN